MRHYFKCTKCSGKCWPADGLRCLVCDSTTNSGMDNNLHPKLPEIAVPGEEEAASGSRNHVVMNSMPLDCTVLLQSRKRKKSKDQITKKMLQPNEQSRQEICKLTDGNRDLMQETNAATSRMSSNNTHSVNTPKAFLNSESQWNIGKFQDSQKDNVPVEISDPRESFGKSAHSGHDIFAIPRPTGFCGNQHAPNVLAKQFKPSNTVAIRSTLFSRNPELYSCKSCGEDIDKHTTTDSWKNSYFCCVCEYETSKTADLQIHIDIHCSKNVCSVCSKEYTEGTSHDSQQKCMECGKTFPCRTELDEHSLVHETYFEIHCWGCSLEIEEHSTRKDGQLFYFCCVCGYNAKNKSILRSHSHVHRPKIFCKTCREEYPEEQKDLHNSGYTCFMCKKKFQCRTQLEDHYQENASHVEYFSKHCRLCDEIITKHVIECAEKQYLKCCYCDITKNFYLGNQFKYHLFTHPGLGLFKCNICGKRFLCAIGLSNHSRKCIPCLFKCQVCRARFPCNHSLDKHCLEKHRQI